jgi:hypothetical protein
MNRRTALTTLASAPLVAHAELDFSALTPVEIEILRACKPEPTGVTLENGSRLEALVFSLRDRGYLQVDGVCRRGTTWHVRSPLGDRALEALDRLRDDRA